MSGNKIIDGLNDILAGAARLEARIVEKHPGFTHVCIVPCDLGAVTKLKAAGSRVVAKTESGVDFIVPTPADRSGE